MNQEKSRGRAVHGVAAPCRARHSTAQNLTNQEKRRGAWPCTAGPRDARPRTAQHGTEFNESMETMTCSVARRAAWRRTAQHSTAFYKQTRPRGASRGTALLCRPRHSTGL